MGGDRTSFLFERKSAATLGLFRICLGALMAWHVARFMPYVTGELVDSRFFLTFDGFHWIRILPAAAMTVLFYGLYAAAALLAAGVFPRAAAALLWLGWTYVVLLGRGHYNNHSFLLSLLCLLMVFVASDRRFSLRRALGFGSRETSVPYWQIFVFKAQFLIVYFYAGLAKLGRDWLAGYPLKIWLQAKADVPWVGTLLASDAAAYAISWGGLLFDLTIGFALFSPRWRRWALVPVLTFHLVNSQMWNIGVFPWLMLAGTSLFFEPDWPDRVLGARRATAAAEQTPPRARTAVLAGLSVYLAWQTLVPLRHLAYPGSPEWHGQGSTFAWRMLAADRVDAMRVRIEVGDQGTVGYVKLDEYVNPTQLARMARMPKSFARFAHFVRDEMRENAGVEGARVYVDVKRRFNGRPFQPLFDPALDMAAVEYRQLAPAPYILPLREDLPRTADAKR